MNGCSSRLARVLMALSFFMLLQRGNEIANTLYKKVSRTKNPWVQLRIQYGSADARGKHYSEENDRFLVCMTNQVRPHA